MNQHNEFAVACTEMFFDQRVHFILKVPWVSEHLFRSMLSHVRSDLQGW